MLIMTRAVRGWRPVLLRAEFRAVPGPGQFSPIIPGGTLIWTPPVRALVRGIVCQPDLGDPLVGNAGAANVQVGLLVNGVFGTGGSVAFVNTNTIASWNTAGGTVRGWGVSGPSSTTLTANVTASGGAEMNPANGFFSGETSGARGIAPSCDAGNVTGTLLFAFEWKPL